MSQTPEWDESCCWFCKREPSDQVAKLDVDLYRVLHRKSTYIVVGMHYTQEYETLKTWVPRCRRCKFIHERVGTILLCVWLVLGTVATVYSFTLPQNRSESTAISIVGGGVSIIMTYFMSLVVVGAAYLFTTMFWRSEEYSAEHPRVVELTRQGWQVGQRPHYKW